MGETIIATTLSTKIQERFRRIKLDCAAAVDIKIMDQVTPWGVDSNPVDGISALVDETNMDGHHVLGYLLYDLVAKPGEIRIYSTDIDVNPMAYVWCKNDGILELNGDADHAVRYSKLEQAFNQLKADFNALVDHYKLHTHSTPGGVTGAPATASTAAASTADISGAKIETIKTP